MDVEVQGPLTYLNEIDVWVTHHVVLYSNTPNWHSIGLHSAYLPVIRRCEETLCYNVIVIGHESDVLVQESCLVKEVLHELHIKGSSLEEIPVQSFVVYIPMCNSIEVHQIENSR